MQQINYGIFLGAMKLETSQSWQLLLIAWETSGKSVDDRPIILKIS